MMYTLQVIYHKPCSRFTHWVRFLPDWPRQFPDFPDLFLILCKWKTDRSIAGQKPVPSLKRTVNPSRYFCCSHCITGKVVKNTSSGSLPFYNLSSILFLQHLINQFFPVNRTIITGIHPFSFPVQQHIERDSTETE